MNIYEKLAKIRSLCEVMSKNKSGYSYKYVSIDEILAKVTAGMKKYKISLIPQLSKDSVNVAPWSYSKTKSTRDGKVYEEHVNEMVVSGGVVYRWINDEDPTEYIDIPWYMTGSQSDPSQAMGSALTYSLRYFLLQFFQIATLDGEDPDNWRSRQKEAEAAEDKEIASKIVEQVHQLVTSYLEKNPSERDVVISVVKQYAKKNGKPSTNYYDIDSSVVASKLLDDVKNRFVENEREE